ncbi:hypothetical protein H6P81_019233 [Aristolochia fimbriata]|uniref:Uncharacterized protein n=1 Tax=Aristolochia fimbriata TaxID=158543 RepID=A0AAV7DVU7_ARIFI|nr:hypothetical protein H6P81_019233 [Aristolochia fimbriata]
MKFCYYKFPLINPKLYRIRPDGELETGSHSPSKKANTSSVCQHDDGCGNFERCLALPFIQLTDEFVQMNSLDLLRCEVPFFLFPLSPVRVLLNYIPQRILLKLYGAYEKKFLTAGRSVAVTLLDSPSVSESPIFTFQYRITAACYGSCGHVFLFDFPRITKYEMAGRILVRSSCSWISLEYPWFQKHPLQKTQSFCCFISRAAHVSHYQAEDPQFRSPMLLSYLLQSLSEVEKSLSILSSFKLLDQALSTLTTHPRVLQLGLLKRLEALFSKSGISHISLLMLQNLMDLDENSRIDSANFSRIVQILKERACSDETLTTIIEKFPRVMVMNPTVISKNIELLRQFGIGEEKIDEVLNSFPGILGFSVEGRLRPLFEEFESLGFNQKEVTNAIINDPHVLNVEIGELSVCVQLLKNLNCRYPIQETILSNGLLKATLAVKFRVDCLCRYGFIHREAFKLLQREPRVIIYSMEDLEKKIDYLVKDMGFSICCLNEVPEYLGVNLKKVVVPRFNVIQYLKSNGGLTYELELRDLIKPSKQKFYNRFVKPYPACQKIFGPLSGSEVERAYPVGLWSLFKPNYTLKEKNS